MHLAPAKLQPPYDLPPLPTLDPSVAKSIDRRNIKRFLQIEGLLRSKQVWALYNQAIKKTAKKRKAPNPSSVDLWQFLYGENRLLLRGERDARMRRLLWDTSLQTQFNVVDGWAVLLGSHHRYLRHQNIPFRIGEEIVDLSILHQSSDLSFKLDYLKEKQPRYLFVMIDSAEVSASDLRALQDNIRKRQQDYIRKTGLVRSVDTHDIQAWLRYLQCYDAHKYQGKSGSQVASIVYKAPMHKRLTEKDRTRKHSSRRQVVRACNQVDNLILTATRGPWTLEPLFNTHQ